MKKIEKEQLKIARERLNNINHKKDFGDTKMGILIGESILLLIILLPFLVMIICMSL